MLEQVASLKDTNHLQATLHKQVHDLSHVIRTTCFLIQANMTGSASKDITLLHQGTLLSLCYVPQVNIKTAYTNSLAHSMWRNKGTMRCTVHHTEEVISMYQIARWGPLQIANIWQVNFYAKVCF